MTNRALALLYGIFTIGTFITWSEIYDRPDGFITLGVWTLLNFGVFMTLIVLNDSERSDNGERNND